MEGSMYVDLFATKGIEYLLVIGFLLSLIFFWRFLNQSLQPSRELQFDGKPAVISNEWFYLADRYFYHQGHAWVKPVSMNYVRVGIDDFAQKLLGKPDRINVPKINTFVEQGEAGLKLQFGSNTIEILSPVTGTVVQVNRQIIDSPAIINDDPYGNGWIMKVKVSKMNTILINLLTGGLAKHWMNNTLNIIRRRMYGQLEYTFQDGGTPIHGFVRTLSPDNWEEVAKEFLMSK
jgi:glycine cleavage system H protein